MAMDQLKGKYPCYFKTVFYEKGDQAFKKYYVLWFQ